MERKYLKHSQWKKGSLCFWIINTISMKNWGHLVRYNPKLRKRKSSLWTEWCTLLWGVEGGRKVGGKMGLTKKWTVNVRSGISSHCSGSVQGSWTWTSLTACAPRHPPFQGRPRFPWQCHQSPPGPCILLFWFMNRVSYGWRLCLTSAAVCQLSFKIQ